MNSSDRPGTSAPSSSDADGFVALDAALTLVVGLRERNDDAAMDVVLAAGEVTAGPQNLAIAAAQIAGHAILEVARLRGTSPELVDVAMLEFVRQFSGDRKQSDG